MSNWEEGFDKEFVFNKDMDPTKYRYLLPEQAKPIKSFISQEIAKAEAEAVKEFAEKLKDRAYVHEDTYPRKIVDEEIIDSLAEEEKE